MQGEKRSILDRLIVPAIAIVALAVGVVGGAIYSQKMSHRQLMQIVQGKEHLPTNKLEATIQLIDRFYVDSIKLDTLLESMMPMLVNKLDPHSVYIPAKDMSRANESLDGGFDGIGVVFNMATDTVIILNVITSGPSAKAGILARDRILTIDGRNVAGEKISQDSVVSQLKGPRDTKVLLGIERGGVDELLEIEVTRGKIPIHSITSAFMIKEGVGYMRLAQFSRTTYSEFIAAVNKLRLEGLQSLIFDLRGNSGGFMDQAIHLANEFLPDSALIVYTQDRSGRQDRQYSNRDGQLQDLPLAVLIDEGSASSSEILAGALQDNDKGLIIGRRSFGKGLVQQQVPFGDGSALRLTVARYYTPTGRSIQKPYEMGAGERYEAEIYDRIAHEELFTADSISFADSLRYVTPKGTVVYGGGGIMPNIFVPLSKESLPKFFVEVSGKNILYRYTIDYSDRHRDALAAVETIDDLDRLLSSDQNLVSDFIAYAKREGAEVTSEEDLRESTEYLERQLRAYIGRNTKLEDNGFYANIYPLDDVLMRAIEEMQQ